MYEEMRAALIEKLGEKGYLDHIDDIISVVDEVSKDYSIEKRETGLAVAFQWPPEEVKNYLASRVCEGYAKGSVQNSFYTLKRFFEKLRMPVNEVTRNDIRCYLAFYREHCEVSGATLDKVRAQLLTFFSWCCSEGYIPVNPCDGIGKIKTETKPRRAMTRAELEQFRLNCETVREKALSEFLYSTACRIDEACGVKLSDINLEEGTVTVTGKGSKTRTTFLSARAILYIKLWLEERNKKGEYLFGNEHTGARNGSKALRTVIENVANRAGLPWVTPHIFRHTAATHALDGGMPVEEISNWLGHSQLSTTMIYAEVNQNSIKNNHNKLIA